MKQACEYVCDGRFLSFIFPNLRWSYVKLGYLRDQGTLIPRPGTLFFLLLFTFHLLSSDKYIHSYFFLFNKLWSPQRTRITRSCYKTLTSRVDNVHFFILLTSLGSAITIFFDTWLQMVYKCLHQLIFRAGEVRVST